MSETQKIEPLRFDAIFFADRILQRAIYPQRWHEWRDATMMAKLLLNHEYGEAIWTVHAHELGNVQLDMRIQLTAWIGAGCPSVGLKKSGYLPRLEALARTEPPDRQGCGESSCEGLEGRMF